MMWNGITTGCCYTGSSKSGIKDRPLGHRNGFANKGIVSGWHVKEW
tara:strand:+ start:169 stop:306 length:138 start_codon:yes stop_codon:yes gene_type:complete